MVLLRAPHLYGLFRILMVDVKKETISGAKWLLLQKCTVQPLQFLYSMVLARLITPAEMGIVGLTAVFFAVAVTLSSSGLGAALIRKLDRTDEDCDTMFWFNLGMSIIFAIALYSAAPWFVAFYNQPELLWLTRCSAFMMVLSSSAGVHWTLYSARRDFKTPAIIQSAASIISMPVCLVLAYLGWGVWALMCGTVTSSAVSLIAVWCVSPWKPRMRFSKVSFYELFGFGCKLTAASLLHTLYSHLRTFIIGKFYSPADLGMYSKGARLAELTPQTISSLLGSVTFPILATLQNDKERLTSVYRKYIKVATIPIAWGCVVMMALAKPMVGFCYGDAWLPCVIYVQIIACCLMFDHICIINLNLLNVIGRSDLILRLEIIKKFISILFVLYAATISVTAICISMAIYSQIAVFINSYYTGRYIGLTWLKQQKDYWPYIILSLFSVIPAFLLTLTKLPDIVVLFVGAVLSIVIYLFLLIYKKDGLLLELLQPLEKKVSFLKKPMSRISAWINR